MVRLAPILAGLALLAAPGQVLGDTTIDFETPALAHCTSVTDQYAGIRFVTGSPDGIEPVYTPATVELGAGAHSGTRALVVADCSSEFNVPQAAIQLDQTRAGVSMYVRDPDVGFDLRVQLRAYDASGARIDTSGDSYATLVGGASAWTQIAAATSDDTNRIATVVLKVQDGVFAEGVHVQIDDLELIDAPGPPPPPDFTLGPASVVVVKQGGGHVRREIPKNLLNGSTGATTAAASNVPENVQVDMAGTAPDYVPIFVEAGLFAPPGPGGFTLTATPTGPDSGPAPRSTTVPIFVETTLPEITISDPAEGTQLDRPPYAPVARGTFTARRSYRGDSTICIVVTHTPEPPPFPASCEGTVAVREGEWSRGIEGLTPGANYITAFIRDAGGYVGSATRLLRIVDETSGVDLRINGVEVTQGVQKTTDGLIVPARNGDTSASYRGVQLVQGRQTYVRVFANTNVAARSDGTTPNITARIRVFSGGREVPGSPFMPLPTIRDLAVGPYWATFAERADFGSSYRFTLPTSLSSDGPLTLEVSINDGLFTPIVECAACTANNTLRITDVRFRPVRTREIYPMRFFDTFTGRRRSAGSNPQTIFAATKRVIPFRVIVHPYVATIDITDSIRQAMASGDSIEDRIIHFPGDYERDHNPNGPAIGVHRGAYAGMAMRTVNCCELRIDPYAVVTEERPFTSVAHEFGHTEDLQHADHACGGDSNGQSADDDWPESLGLLLGIGFDPVGRRALPDLDPVTREPRFYDFMSYCAAIGGGDPDSWISTRNWDRLVDHEATGPALRSADGHTHARATQGVPGPGLAVTAVLSADGSTAQITNVQPTESGAIASDPAGDVQLMVLGADGSSLSATSVVSTLVHTGRPGPARRMVSIVVPSGSDPRAVQLRRRETVLATRTASANPPKVSIVAPRRGATVGRALTVRWRGTDRDGDRLAYAIDQAAVPRARFKMVAAGLTGTRASIPLAMLAPARRARIRVRALDGFRQGAAVIAGIRIPAARPQVTIVEPAAGTSVPADSVVSLVGHAFGARSKLLAGRALTWRVDGRRVAGGVDAYVTGLAPGTRKITLTAVSGRRRASAIRRIRVTRVTPRLLSTGAPARLSRRARALTLKLSASVPSTLRIAGGTRPVRVRVDRRPRSYRLSIRPAARPLALVLRLRGGGGSASHRLSIARG